MALCVAGAIRGTKYINRGDIVKPPFKRNLGRLDQVLRLGIGVVLVYMGFIDTTFIGDSVIAGMVGAFGILNLVVSAIAWCPVYQLAGISTRPSAP